MERKDKQSLWENPPVNIFREKHIFSVEKQHKFVFSTFLKHKERSKWSCRSPVETWQLHLPFCPFSRHCAHGIKQNHCSHTQPDLVVVENQPDLEPSKAPRPQHTQISEERIPAPRKCLDMAAQNWIKVPSRQLCEHSEHKGSDTTVKN